MVDELQKSVWTVETMTFDELSQDESWWRIYEASFPRSERESRDVILKSVLSGDGMAFRLRRGGSTIGLATTHLLRDPAAVFLVYLAVAPRERNRGSGAALLEEAWRAGADRLLGAHLQPLGMIWEVERPLCPGIEAETCQRRIEFFRRRGGQPLKRPYLQPPLDGTAPVPMMLMYRSANGEPIPTPDTVNALVEAIYFEKYGAINGIEHFQLEELLNTA